MLAERRVADLSTCPRHGDVARRGRRVIILLSTVEVLLLRPQKCRDRRVCIRRLGEFCNRLALIRE